MSPFPSMMGLLWSECRSTNLTVFLLYLYVVLAAEVKQATMNSR